MHFFHPKANPSKVKWVTCRPGFAFQFQPIPEEGYDTGNWPDPGTCEDVSKLMPYSLMSSTDSAKIFDLGRQPAFPEDPPVWSTPGNRDWHGTIDGTFYRLQMPQSGNTRYGESSGMRYVSYCGRVYSYVPVDPIDGRQDLSSFWLRKDSDSRIWLYGIQTRTSSTFYGNRCGTFSEIRLWKRPFTKDLSGALYPAADNGWRLVQDWYDLEADFGEYATAFSLVFGCPGAPYETGYCTQINPNASGTKAAFIIYPAATVLGEPYHTWKVVVSVTETGFTVAKSQASGFSTQFTYLLDATGTEVGVCGFNNNDGWQNMSSAAAGTYGWSSEITNTIDYSGQNYVAVDYDGDTEVVAYSNVSRDFDSYVSCTGSFTSSPPTWSGSSTYTLTEDGDWHYYLSATGISDITLFRQEEDYDTSGSRSQSSGGVMTISGSRSADVSKIDCVSVLGLDLRWGYSNVVYRRLLTGYSGSGSYDGQPGDAYVAGTDYSTTEYRQVVQAKGVTLYDSGWVELFSDTGSTSVFISSCGVVCNDATDSNSGNVSGDYIEDAFVSDAGWWSLILSDLHAQYLYDEDTGTYAISTSGLAWVRPDFITDQTKRTFTRLKGFTTAEAAWDQVAANAYWWPPSSKYPDADADMWCHYDYYNANKDELMLDLYGIY